MVRALTEAWAALGRHPRGRWLRLVLEVLWYLGVIAAVYARWDAPQAFFGYLTL